jgi:predicted dehydrogenase
MRRRTFTEVLGAGVALGQAAAQQKRIKAAVITDAGGAHLNYYYESLAKAEEVESVAVCDPSGQSLDMARKMLGRKIGNIYKDEASLLRAEPPTLAVITLDGASSPAAITAAINANCHVLAEKPACVRIEDFERMHQLAKERKRHLILALANRSDSVFLEARRLVQEGQIGKIYGVEVHLIADQTRLTKPEYHKSWRAKKAMVGGGHLMWLGIHWLDLAMFITKSPIRQVTGFTTNIGGQPIDTEDSAVVAMQFGNGALGTLTSGYYLDKGYHSHLKIWGSKGWLHVQKHTEVPLEWYSTLDANPQVRRWEEPKKPTGYMYPAFIRNVARAAAGLDAPLITADEGLVVLKTVYACYKAAATGQTQRLA